MIGPQPRRRGLTPEAIAGWLFADLLLVLFIVGLGSQVTKSVAEPRPSPSASASKSERPKEPGMRTKPVVLSVPARADALLSGPGPRRRAAVRALDREISKELRSPRVAEQTEGLKAAVVLAFGQTGSDVSKGQRLARQVLRELPNIDPLFKDAADGKALWNGSATNRVELWIYLFS